jgi:hypothetical protein
MAGDGDWTKAESITDLDVVPEWITHILGRASMTRRELLTALGSTSALMP